MNPSDARARQAMMMAKKSPKASMHAGSGRAILFIAGAVVMAIAAIWFAIDLIRS